LNVHGVGDVKHPAETLVTEPISLEIGIAN